MTTTTSPSEFSIASTGAELEAEWARPAGARGTVVLSHPHPQYGGDMWNPLIDHLYRELSNRGIAVLRYNFRGTGASTGSFDGGAGERKDAAAAFAAAAEVVSDGPVISAGWSFGAVMSLAADHGALRGWVGIATPMTMGDPSTMTAALDERPKLLLVPEFDQFTTPEAATMATASWANTTIETLNGTDHSVSGRANDVVDAVQTMVESFLPQ